MAQCMFPYAVERKLYHSQEGRYVSVPCGKCPNCLKRRVASWSFRLEIEALQWQKQYFVTLTYDTDFVPISKNSFMTLKREDLTSFFKRLRHTAGKLKYYACGEYGTNNKRPHYHIILFGTSAMTQNDIISAWSQPNTGKHLGDVYFGKVEPASIRYTVQYYDKGEWRPAHARDDRAKEFSAMSQGIGKSFLDPKMVEYLLQNPDKGYVYNKEGKKIAIPRYYKKRLYDYQANLGTVAQHPSLLLHRDEQLELKKVHNEEMRKLIDAIEQPEENESLNEDRKQAIYNYRQSKRKTRK